MPIPKDKNKFVLWVRPDAMERVEKWYEEDGCRTKSEFIERAINFYCGYLSAEDNQKYLPEVILSTVKGSLDSLENRMARNLFKIALELAMVQHVISATNEFDEDALNRLRGKCVDEISHINGTLDFEDAYRYQKK